MYCRRPNRLPLGLVSEMLDNEEYRGLRLFFGLNGFYNIHSLVKDSCAEEPRSSMTERFVDLTLILEIKLFLALITFQGVVREERVDACSSRELRI
ncbi:hypothetical protein FQR65_LT04451 [Abscondita terminalis]|nr:hypothetical protein FQR65_LT04451 [Abscondita terminalis]